jgi:hypothetical protein
MHRFWSDQRHRHLVCQPLRKQGAELQPTEPRTEDHDLALHPLSMLRLLWTCSTNDYVTNMGETRNPENLEPMTAAERMRGHRARQLGDDVPKVKPGPKPGKPQTLREASLEELIDEVSDRLTGRMADDREIRELAFRGVVHSYQTSGDRLSFVSIEPFAEE